MTLAGTLLLSSLPLLISLYVEKYRMEDLRKAFPRNPPDFGLPVNEQFDFIIVGGGTAGCVLARRLADARYSVLLLEAGGDPPPIQAVPLTSYYSGFLPGINFLYKSAPQKNIALSTGGVMAVTSAKMLGGCTSHNDMIYERGSALGYDEWAEITGDPSWKYSKMLKYFRKLEKYMGSFPSRQHGYHGPIAVELPKYAPGRDVWLQAGRERGFEVRDASGPQQIVRILELLKIEFSEIEGFSPNEFYTEYGRRSSAYTGYVKPVEGKLKNLEIRRYSLASKVHIKNKRAVGVVYTRHGIPRYASARKEVILSAGGYISPIILINSGIGPPDELAAAKVKPVKYLPVGYNLRNHPLLSVGPIYVGDHSKSWTLDQNCSFQDFDDFLFRGEGPGLHYITAEAYIASKVAKAGKYPTLPDLQIYYSYQGTEKNSVLCKISTNGQYSIGRLTVNRSATGMEDDRLPILNYNYYSKEEDYQATIEGINFCLDTVEKTQAFKRIGARFTTVPIPKCRQFVFRSYQYWKCYIQQLTESTNHTSGACKMGKRKDKNSVVDPKLRVIGIKRLRVVDTSIMPSPPNANLAVPVMAVAEKAARMILRKYNGRA